MKHSSVCPRCLLPSPIVMGGLCEDCAADIVEARVDNYHAEQLAMDRAEDAHQNYMAGDHL